MTHDCHPYNELSSPNPQQPKGDYPLWYAFQSTYKDMRSAMRLARRCCSRVMAVRYLP